MAARHPVPTAVAFLALFCLTRVSSGQNVICRITNDPVAALPAGSPPAGERWYSYDWFDIPPTEGTNAMPLSIALDGYKRLWVNPEFHLRFFEVRTDSRTVVPLVYPRPADPGPFATTIFGDHRTQTSMCGEDVIIDPSGRIWFSQGGGYLYDGEHPNHSRILCYDPSVPEESRWRVYNIPGDRNEIIGLAWDERRGLLWFANGGLGAKGIWRGSLACFDPSETPHDGTFDFSTSIDDRICSTPLSELAEPRQLVTGGNFRVYPLADPGGQPAHLAFDAEGNVWYTEFWGNAIGRLEPDTGIVTRYPLAKARAKTGPAAICGSGPWQIIVEPDGDIVFNEFFDAQVCRLPLESIENPAALSLAEDGTNPCVQEVSLPDADLEREQIHSIVLDGAGNLWFSVHNSDTTARGLQLGFIPPDWSGPVLLPSFRNFPGQGHATADGIAVDRETGAVYMAEFFHKRIGRITPVPPAPVDH